VTSGHPCEKGREPSFSQVPDFERFLRPSASAKRRAGCVMSVRKLSGRGQLVVPAKAGTQEQVTEIPGSRFRGNDGYENEWAGVQADRGSFTVRIPTFAGMTKTYRYFWNHFWIGLSLRVDDFDFRPRALTARGLRAVPCRSSVAHSRGRGGSKIGRSPICRHRCEQTTSDSSTTAR